MPVSNRQSYWLGTTAPTRSTAALLAPGRGVTRTTQPQQATQVDWGNPISRGLAALFDQRIGLDVVNGVRASANTAALAASRQGVALDYSGTANTQYPHHPAYAITGPLSIVAVLDVDTLTNYGAVIAKQATVTTQIPCELRLGSGTTDALIDLVRGGSGYREHRGTANALSAGYSGALVVTYPTGTLANTGGFAYTRNGTFGLTDLAGPGSGAVTDNGASPVWIGRRSDGATQLDGRIYYVALFTRELSAAEARSIVANPWQLFLPTPNRIMVPA